MIFVIYLVSFKILKNIIKINVFFTRNRQSGSILLNLEIMAITLIRCEKKNAISSNSIVF